MRPPSYYTSLANSNPSTSSNYRASNSTSSSFRSSFSSPSSSTYMTRTHLPYVSQSMLVAHCITGVSSSTKPQYNQSTSSSTSGYLSSSSSSLGSSYAYRPISTKRPIQSSNPYLSSSPSTYSYTSPSSSYSRSSSSYRSPSSRTTSSYRRPDTSLSSYYKPIRLRERPLLTQISRQLNTPSPTFRQTTHSPSTRRQPEPTAEEASSKKGGDDEANWSSDVARNISRNKYLIKFREFDKRPSIEPIILTNQVAVGQLVETEKLNLKASEQPKELERKEKVLKKEEEMKIPVAELPVEEKEKAKQEEPEKEKDSFVEANEKKKAPTKEKRNLKLKVKNLTTSEEKKAPNETKKVAKKAAQDTSSESTTGDSPPSKAPKVKRLVKSGSKSKLTNEKEGRKVLAKQQPKEENEKENVELPLSKAIEMKAECKKNQVDQVLSPKVTTENKRIRFRQYHIEDFNFLSVLGHGGWGFVILAELKEHDACFAVKCIKKITIVEDDDFDSIMIERKVLTLGNVHPFICKLFCTFETDGYLFFAMEYCAGGDLMFHVQREGKFTESRCRFYAAEIICAIRFLHKQHIIYRDLKLDNILLDSSGHIRLVDFGMCQCRTYREEMLPSNFCGTPEYISPEIIKGVPYNHSVDWWSFGVLLYEMAVGKMPFRGNDENELLWNVCYEQIHYPMFLTRELTTLLQLLLEREPTKRMGMATCKAGDIYDQPWFRGTDWAAFEAMRVKPPFVPEVNSMRDVQNFDADFTQSAPELSPVDESTLKRIDQNQFQKFPYTNPNIFIFDYPAN